MDEANHQFGHRAGSRCYIGAAHHNDDNNDHDNDHVNYPRPPDLAGLGRIGRSQSNRPHVGG
jgi:hypothetical protein